MESPIRLSYLIVTMNKLPYFKNGLKKLIAEKQNDEEIIIGDGNSTDGTKEYLEKMKTEGKIDDYTSEPDHCESPALNKLFLKARGEIIKIINDDDAYYYPIIRECKEFMLNHPEIDILGMEGGSYKHALSGELVLHKVAGYTENYKRWQKEHKPFEFAVLGLMFRRSSLPILGFWNLSFKNADAEYTFRSTAGPAVLAWCTNPAFVFIRTPEGVTMSNWDRMKKETSRLREFYLDEKKPPLFVRETKALLRQFLNWSGSRGLKSANSPSTWESLYKKGEKWLIEQNRNRKVEFLWSK